MSITVARGKGRRQLDVFKADVSVGPHALDGKSVQIGLTADGKWIRMYFDEKELRSLLGLIETSLAHEPSPVLDALNKAAAAGKLGPMKRRR